MGIFDLFGGGGSVPRNAPSPTEKHELLLYKYDSCPYCRRVAHAVGQLGLDVPTADILMDRANRDALIAKTGRSQVPCLFIDGQPLFESADIVAWLGAYAEGGAKA
ncbi:MAG: glutaredoxin [Alphaproteobacteria bacterium]|nr:glutaredoxin [Alphaproteobacteria bacterium]